MSPAIVLTLTLIGIGFATALVRTVRGPSVADRAVATDVGLYCIIAVLAVIAVTTGMAQFLDVVLIATLLGFLASVALAALVGRGRP